MARTAGRNHVGGAVHGDLIYALGGQFFEQEGCTNQKLVEAYDSRTNKWSKVASLPGGLGHISPATLSTKYGIIVVAGIVQRCNREQIATEDTLGSCLTRLFPFA